MLFICVYFDLKNNEIVQWIKKGEHTEKSAKQPLILSQIKEHFMDIIVDTISNDSFSWSFENEIPTATKLALCKLNLLGDKECTLLDQPCPRRKSNSRH